MFDRGSNTKICCFYSDEHSGIWTDPKWGRAWPETLQETVHAGNARALELWTKVWMRSRSREWGGLPGSDREGASADPGGGPHLPAWHQRSGISFNSDNWSFSPAFQPHLSSLQAVSRWTRVWTAWRWSTPLLNFVVLMLRQQGLQSASPLRFVHC